MTDPVEKWASVTSKLLVPLVIATGAWWVQRAISEQTAATQYVAIAISILSNREQERDLRQWAVRVLDRYSTVPLSEPLQLQLVEGTAYFMSDFNEWALRSGIKPSQELLVIDPGLYEYLRSREQADMRGESDK